MLFEEREWVEHDRERILARGTPEAIAAVKNMHALKRIASPEEIARSALDLASDASSFTTGTAMLVDRGVSISKPRGGARCVIALYARAMLELRPSCECCDRALPAESTEARICSFECTFCVACVEEKLGGRCPNCGGELVARPRRPASKLAAHPASTVRVHKPQGCTPSA